MVAVTFLAFLIPVAVLGLIVWAIVAFVPAWIYAMTRLVQDLRRPHGGATTPEA